MTDPTLLELARTHAATGEFVLASGKKSDFYFDGRALLMDPVGLQKTVNELDVMLDHIHQKTGAEWDACGGVVLGACPMVTGLQLVYASSGEHGPWLPSRYFFVRKKPKDHGVGSQFVGTLIEGDRVLMLEDTITTGGTLLKTIDLVEAAGGLVTDVLCVLNREEGGGKLLRERGIRVHSMFVKADLS